MTLMSATAANAAVVDKISLDADTQIVTVSGEIPEADNKGISFVVLNPGYSADDLAAISRESFSEVVNYYAQIPTSEDGKYSHTFHMKGETGEYELVLNCADGALSQSPLAIKFSDAQTVSDAISAFCDADNTDAMMQCIADYHIALDLDVSAYNSFDESVKTEIADCLISEKASLNGIFNTAAQIRDCFKSASLLNEIKQTADKAKLLNIINKNTSFMKLEDLSVYDAWQTYLDSDGREIVCTALYERASNATNLSDISHIFAEEVILAAVEALPNYRDLKDLLICNKEYLSELDFGEYESQSNTSSIDKDIAGKHFSNISELCDAINDLLYTGNSSGFGGGGGGSSSGGSKFPSSPSFGSSPVYDVPKQDKPSEPIDLPFDDIDQSFWAYKAVSNLYSKGIINGKTPNEFFPNDNITREEFVKLLVLACNVEDGGEKVAFTDVSESEWYYKYIVSAFSDNIVTGKSDGSFGIGEHISRQDMAVMVCRACNRTMPVSTADFEDNDAISDYARESVAKLSAAGIINGMPDGSFAPFATATRAEAAKLVYELIKWEASANEK